jgi:hypothetical protein
MRGIRRHACVGGRDRRRVGIEREDGLLGNYELTENGDPSVGPVTVFQAGETFEPEREITPESDLVAAARAG